MKRHLLLFLLCAGLAPGSASAAPGASPGDPIPLVTGPAATLNTFVRDTDMHWYRFSAAPTLEYTVRVRNVTLWDNEVDLRVFADGEAVASAGSVTHSDEGSTLVWRNTGGLRNYTLSVAAFLQFTTGTYSVAVTANDADSDGDQLPDAWESLHFGGPTNAVAQGGNAAGVTNWESFATGTDPNDPGGALRVSSLRRTPASLEIAWNAVPYAAYGVEVCPSLLAVPAWKTLTRVQTLGAGGRLAYPDAADTARTNLYRIVYLRD